MANAVRLFESETGSYSGGYTSKILNPTGYRYKIHRDYPPLFTRGIIQVEVTSGDLKLEARLSEDAPWIILKTWESDAIEQLVLALQMRVVASDSSRAWLGEMI